LLIFRRLRLIELFAYKMFRLPSKAPPLVLYLNFNISFVFCQWFFVFWAISASIQTPPGT
ncbi:MAG: hypothetical protein FWH05_04085, partial [Oscillospiraceae bacterium]|nr:hypothetical protein [Oscillospiraceae bacterium]